MNSLKTYLPEIEVIIKEMEISQFKAEKNAFEMINSSDITLNLIRNGMYHIQNADYKIEMSNDILHSLLIKIDEWMENIITVSDCMEEFRPLLLCYLKEIREQIEKAVQFTDVSDGIMEEASVTFQKILNSEEKQNDVARTLEKEIVNQRELMELINKLSEKG